MRWHEARFTRYFSKTTFGDPVSSGRMDNHRGTSGVYDPKPQSIYAFQNGLWHPSNGNQYNPTTAGSLTPMKLFTWNIDFQAPLGADRMTAALAHLHELMTGLPPATLAVVLLQEMTASDLTIIQAAPWIRKSFYLTDLNSTHWEADYGTLTLVDSRLPVTSAFRVRYASDMGRDGLFVDMEDRGSSRVLRVCNTHLESLPRDPPLRPAQVILASRYLKDPTIDAAIIGGDFNAIQGFDLTLHEENELRDAYLEGGGDEASQEGWTWGMQSMYDAGKHFGCRRMDKILFCGKVAVEGLEKFGMGLQIDGMVDGPKLYVTDHLGLMADITMVNDP